MYLLVISTANLVLLGLLLGGIRWFTAKLAPILGTASTLMALFQFEEVEEEGKDGEKVKVRRPNPQLLATIEAFVPIAAPIMLKAGKEWMAKNVKIGQGGAPIDPNDLMGGLSGLIGQFLPKKFQQYAPVIGPLLSKFVPGLGGGAVTKGTASSPSLKDNPFM